MKLENKNIIYFSPLNWNDNWQRQQEFASRMAKQNKVLYIMPIGFFNYGPLHILKKALKQLFGIKKGKQRETKNIVPPNLYFATLFFLPRHNSKLFEKWNKKILLLQLRKKLRGLGMEGSYVFWTGNPVRTVTQLIDEIRPEVSVYDNAMRFEKLTGAPDFVLQHEEETVKKVSFAITDNEFKKAQFEEWGAVTYKIPQGVNLDLFDRHKRYEVPESLKNVHHPIVGYYGVLRDVVDFPFLEYASEKLPEYSFVLMGNVWDDANLANLQKKRNVHILPAVPHSELPSYLARFDVALVPYLVNEYTQGTFPNKLFEYFSFLKPVVAEPLPEFAAFQDFMYLASTKESFAESIQTAVKEGAKNIEALKSLVQNNTWTARYEAILQAFQAYHQ